MENRAVETPVFYCETGVSSCFREYSIFKYLRDSDEHENSCRDYERLVETLSETTNPYERS